MERLLIKQLLEIATQNPAGFTVSLPDLKFLKTGWVVAKKETQNCFGRQGLKKALEVALNTSKTMGGWQDGPLFYWDAVEVYFDEETATQAGKRNEQLAIYQLETGRLKWLD